MSPGDITFAKQQVVFRHSWKGFTPSASADVAKPPPSKNDPTPIPEQYHFVISSTAKASSSAKKHVLQQIRRQKQIRSSRALERVTRSGPLRWEKKASPEEVEEPSHDKDPSQQASGVSITDPPSARSLNPVRAVGPGRVDPFGSLPTEGGESESRLVDHFCNGLGFPLLSNRRRVALYTMKDSAFAQCMQDPAAFYSLLSFSAHHLAVVRGENISPAALMYKTEAIRLVNERLSRPDIRSNDGTIQTIVVLSHIEHQFGNNEALRAHLTGLQNLVLMRGGLSAMATNPRLEAQLYWLDFTSARGIFTPLPKGFGSSGGQNAGFALSINPVQSQYLRACCEGFINFFENMLCLASSRKNSPCMLAAVTSAVGPGKPLHQYLWRYHSPFDPPCHGMSKLAILSQLHINMWDHQDSPADTQNYLEHVNQRMEERSRISKLSLDIILWLLVQVEAGDRIHRPKTSWLVRRIITIAKLLSHSSWVMAENVLLNCLLEEGMDKAADLSSWDPERIRQDIIGQLDDEAHFSSDRLHHMKFPEMELPFHKFEPEVLETSILSSPLQQHDTSIIKLPID